MFSSGKRRRETVCELGKSGIRNYVSNLFQRGYGDVKEALRLRGTRGRSDLQVASEREGREESITFRQI